MRGGDRLNEKEGFVQSVFWKSPCTIKYWRGKADVVLSIITHPEYNYDGVDIRIRRNIAHPRGTGFTKQGVRLTVEQAASMWKALGLMLGYLDEEE